MIAFSIDFVNVNDDLYKYAAHIADIPNYDTVVCHGSERCFYIYNNDGVELEYTAAEFSEMIKNSSTYSGGNIRLISCNTGSAADGVAQMLANIMQVNVMAPTEAVWVNSYGELFVSDYDVLAQMWYEGEKVIETGKWQIFVPNRKE